jgi:hypothetical protein
MSKTFARALVAAVAMTLVASPGSAVAASPSGDDGAPAAGSGVPAQHAPEAAVPQPTSAPASPELAQPRAAPPGRAPEPPARPDDRVPVDPVAPPSPRPDGRVPIDPVAPPTSAEPEGTFRGIRLSPAFTLPGIGWAEKDFFPFTTASAPPGEALLPGVSRKVEVHKQEDGGDCSGLFTYDITYTPWTWASLNPHIRAPR